MSELRVLLVTGGGACGIAEYGLAIQAAVHGADPGVTFLTNPDWLDPGTVPTWGYDLIHLNYHAALHSRWTPAVIHSYQVTGLPVLVTYHDSGVPSTDQCTALHAVATAFVVHEPVGDLPGATYWRQGVPAWVPPYHLASGPGQGKGWDGQPVLGTVGFPFPWKNYDLLAEVTAAAGWGLLLLAPTATPEDVARWQGLNPYALVRTDFLPAEAVVAHLAGCDATAFLYTCHNAGTSGAIRQGLAARKPVLASPPGMCRQFRDLADAYGGPATRAQDGGPSPLTWVVPDPQHVVPVLRGLRLSGRVDPGIVWIAEQDSWARLGRRYAALYRELEGRR